MTLGTGKLLTRIGHVYTRQHICLLAEKGKIPWATKKGARWLFDDTGELCAWIKRTKLSREREFKVRGLKSRNAPSPKYPNTLSTSQLAKRCGMSERQVARLAASQLKEFHVLTKGGHHRFRDGKNLKKWSSALNYSRAAEKRRKNADTKLKTFDLADASRDVAIKLRHIIDWCESGPAYRNIKSWPTAHVERIANDLGYAISNILEFTDLAIALEEELKGRSLTVQSSNIQQPGLASPVRGNS